MNVAEMAELYRKAQVVRDETVRRSLQQSLAQLAATQEALERAQADPAFGSASKSDAGAGHLAERAQADTVAASDAAAKLIGARGKSVVPARGAQLVAAEAIAAESVAAEAISAEAVAVEAAEGVFNAEPFAVESAMLEGTMAEGIEAVGESLRAFVAQNEITGK